VNQERFVGIGIQLDANRINSRGRLENVNRLERWADDGVILLSMSEVAQLEAAAGGDATREAKAYSYIASGTFLGTPDERAKLLEIERILFGGACPTTGDRNDALIVFNAWKYGRLLVTADGGSRSQPGGILGNRAVLRTAGIEVATDGEAVATIKHRIDQRDKLAKFYHQRDGRPLPDWVAHD